MAASPKSIQTTQAHKCSICKSGHNATGTTTVTLQRGETIVIINQIPAEICADCGEYYLSEDTTASVMALAERSIQHGAEVEILRFVA